MGRLIYNTEIFMNGTHNLQSGTIDNCAGIIDGMCGRPLWMGRVIYNIERFMDGTHNS